MKHITIISLLALHSLASAAQASASSPRCKQAASACASQTSQRGQIRTAKTSMGAQINYTIMNSLVVGSVTQVRLTVQTATPGQPLTVTLTADPALRLEGQSGTGPLPLDASAGYTLDVVPQREGLHYINVYLRSGDMTEALAIPMQVGKTQTLPKSVDVQTMPDGQRVKAIPAQQ
ncbi:MAG: hypothetical protein B7X59_02050 [Polaromonas sp. 39-63-203]|jgi:hypothetical protein|uniref:hypothetical protein n=1 Tax=Polaromonas sp. TaxID=1869339 RepID=UPI000BD37D4E|nr:hypothetical protein [Polaromonas sp.]OYY53692.1 MAG: hypothetical protein B7Y54_01995 [Polaromonas sp. 35-63-240]OYZ01570.1 MAG: hypothetical protein B7Y42_03200 [Polaromonas sp. 28-63-22]OYZ84694.1 MAG: hypothetical protein B7Y03_02500 [Polaromonas sp. 24-62-144]OZB01058.1 MAG: hypothetical protein B7X59_02050 [Polaromonas sp. 39-63-203]HQS31890.1 hypothetical protein [Polaromonas sp.]